MTNNEPELSGANDDDVEGHAQVKPFAHDENDDVEGHAKVKSIADDDDDDVEGHVKKKL